MSSTYLFCVHKITKTFVEYHFSAVYFTNEHWLMKKRLTLAATAQRREVTTTAHSQTCTHTWSTAKMDPIVYQGKLDVKGRGKVQVTLQPHPRHSGEIWLIFVHRLIKRLWTFCCLSPMKVGVVLYVVRAMLLTTMPRRQTSWLTIWLMTWGMVWLWSNSHNFTKVSYLLSTGLVASAHVELLMSVVQVSPSGTTTPSRQIWPIVPPISLNVSGWHCHESCFLRPLRCSTFILGISRYWS